MEAPERANANKSLPIILIAAVVQGWALYGLYFAIEHKHWPSTQPAWLTALYSIALLIPLTVQLLVEHIRKPVAMGMVAVLALILFGMGWYNGGALIAIASEQRNDFSDLAPFAFELIVLWLLVLPFMQARLIDGSWRVCYETLFATAWRNKLALVEAAAFTGALWLLLMLWQALFSMLGMRFFRELFSEPLFIYPVTSITFGMALHLIGSVERFTSVVLEQTLNVLKWLAVVAGLILALFTLTLVFKLPNLFATGDRVISAVWLLWLIAVVVLLVNAAYRDGTVDRPYPQAIAIALRLVVPLTIVISLTALYALWVRAEKYGLTVERVWAFVVAGAALIYSIGYGLAAWRGGRWMSAIARVNIVAALALIAVIALALSPMLSPYRLAANSQARIAISQAIDTARFDSALLALRFDAGRYGQEKLRELAQLQDHPEAVRIHAAVAAVQLKTNRWEEPQVWTSVDAGMDTMPMHPAGAVIDARLKEAVFARLKQSEATRRSAPVGQIGGVFIDLDGDAVTEFVLIQTFRADVFQQVGDRWVYAGAMESGYSSGQLEKEFGETVEARRPRWKNLIVGKRVYRPESDAR
jgi:hypothetical protein